MATKKDIVHNEAIERLREVAPAGTSLRCVLGNVAKSGMSRTLRIFYVKTDYVDSKAELVDITGLASRVLGWPCKNGCMRVHGCGMDAGLHGCGMDAGLHAVNSLAYRVWGKSCAQGWRAKETCTDTYHWGGWF